MYEEYPEGEAVTEAEEAYEEAAPAEDAEAAPSEEASEETEG